MGDTAILSQKPGNVIGCRRSETPNSSKEVVWAKSQDESMGPGCQQRPSLATLPLSRHPLFCVPGTVTS